MSERVWKIKEGVYGVDSASKPGHYWIVHTGYRTCDCPGFQFYGNCKHIRAVEEEIGRELVETKKCNLCGKMTAQFVWDGDNGWICKQCAEAQF